MIPIGKCSDLVDSLHDPTAEQHNKTPDSDDQPIVTAVD